jgi:hypothetical protein
MIFFFGKHFYGVFGLTMLRNAKNATEKIFQKNVYYTHPVYRHSTLGWQKKPLARLPSPL